MLQENGIPGTSSQAFHTVDLQRPQHFRSNPCVLVFAAGMRKFSSEASRPCLRRVICQGEKEIQQALNPSLWTPDNGQNNGSPRMEQEDHSLQI